MSRSWIIPFPADHHGRDNRPWFGLIPCHDGACGEFQIVRRKTNGVWYASCDVKHPQIRLGGCGAKYEWGSTAQMPPQTLEELSKHLDTFPHIPREYMDALANAWGLTVDQLIAGDFNHARTEEADQGESNADSTPGEGDTSEAPGDEETAPEIADTSEGTGDPGGDTPEDVGGSQHFQGADTEIAGAAEGGNPDAPDTDPGNSEGTGGTDNPDTEPGPEPSQHSVWDEFKGLYGGDD